MGTNYVKKARTVRLPVVTDIQINSFNTGVPETLGSYIYNGTVLQYPDGKYYVTQRPSFSVFESPADAGLSSPDLRGRGCYYWAGHGVDALYFVNNDTVYKSTYSAPLTTDNLTAGTDPVVIRELNSKLVFVNAESNEMFYIDSATDTTLRSMQSLALASTDITFTSGSPDKFVTGGLVDFSVFAVGDTITITNTVSNNWTDLTISSVNATTIEVVETSIVNETPANCTITRTNFAALPQNNGFTLAGGCAVLDQTMYVLDSDGQVWGCAIADAQNWSDGLNVITAEKEDDAGVYIAKHFDHIVVFGRRTIEFMADAANPIGSPLSVRQDISYNLGCADPNSIWRNGDDIYFLGIDTSGQIQPYVLRDFKPIPLINSGGSSFLTTTMSQETTLETVGSGMSSGGVTYYVMTVYELDGSGNPKAKGSYAHNSSTNIWTQWEFAGTVISGLPLVGYTLTDDSRIGEGILATGELVYVVDNYVPYDTEVSGAVDYVTAGYVGTGYVVLGSTADSNIITMKVRLDNYDADSRDWKFAHQLRYVGDSTQNAQDLQVRWCDNNNHQTNYDDFTDRTIDISSPLNKLTRLGRFKSRSFEFEYTGSEQIRFEGVDLDVTEGSH